ncbi:glucose 1-dehydrogenase [Streptomyces sp. SID8382]|uniref:SDR family NAD(P)-dependent oxidoreductase n=1 Tax=Streptomyces TaxID=1883 RepID=UPI000C2C3433|nr:MULTISPECIES: glucose 1-dehydrogenase [unclassified Streptomyces]AUA16487.1 2-(R)-hydroxypropyl-CoM dehydrogenase [Streptomyces sp. M56]MCD9589349.1 glucose 1-dehydrogenase [Streptomyces sp. 8ZJF_21]MYX57364.1 glucose 1-dehydrogenase [Streptomyces sp. SID8382]
MNRLNGKVAIITGAGSGQGRAAALALATEGARVVAADVNESGLAELASMEERIVTRRCDVSHADEVESLVAMTEERFGALHIMLNCAGYLRAAPLLETTEEMLDAVIGVNLKGVFYGCKFAVPAMQRAGGGSIVNWGSVNSMVAEPDLSAYTATKGAVLMITKSVAIEFAKDDIRANCICPGAVRTPMVESFFDEGFFEDDAAQRKYQPLGFGTPEQIADVAVFLASDESRLMTGSAVVVDGGYTAL